VPPPLRERQRSDADRVRAAFIRSQQKVQAISKAQGSVSVLQKYVQHNFRKMELRRELAKRVAATGDARGKAAVEVQSFMRTAYRRRVMTAELNKRVVATKARKESEAKMAAEKRQAEEKERQRKLEEER
jgi:hypothetical protein